MNSIERAIARGKPIVCFRADGCMAHDHKFQWYGIIMGFHVQERGDKIMLADIAVIKHEGDPQDIRDCPLPGETVIADNIRRLVRGAYMVFI